MPSLTRRQTLLVLTVVLAVITLSAGVYGLVAGPRHREPVQPPSSANSPASEAVGRAGAAGAGIVGAPVNLPRTSDPIAYARAIATRLFTWDTTTGDMPADISAPVVADADPSGQETSGLLVDLASYLPTDAQWLDLAGLKVKQELTIASAVVPGGWSEVVATSHSYLNAGSKAVTISGIRSRAGTWNGEQATSAYDVSFTVFMACPPAYDRCRVLRLSQLNNPLR